jgi:hypothetical protein
MKMSFQLISRIGVLSLALGILLGGCKKEYDTPPLRILPIGQILTIQELRDLYQGDAVRFPEPFSVYCVVTADEQSGNLYRNIHVQDATGAIVLRLNNPGGLYQGDSIRIYLPGTILNPFSGMMQLDSVDVDNNIIKQATQVHVEPELVTISQITPAMQGKLIKLENVEFISSELNLTYADAINESTQNRTLTDCTNNTVIVRTSGYANFANTPVAQGNGSIIAVVSQFNTTMQLYVRNVNEIQMTDERCTGGGGGCNYNIAAVDNFNMNFLDVAANNIDYINVNWQNLAVQNNRVWRGRISGDDKFIRATGFVSEGTSVPPTEIWFVSPPVNFNAAQSLSFRARQQFWTHSTLQPFKVFISIDYDGCDLDGANWTEITGFIGPSSSNSSWLNSGGIPVVGFLPQGYTGTYHIGFRYYAEGLETTTIDLDDIVIQ